MHNWSLRPVVCPTCTKPNISVTYRTDDAIYMHCADCQSVWPMELPVRKMGKDVPQEGAPGPHRSRR
jgi:formate dehydrogenase maturation protein FdhE